MTCKNITIQRSSASPMRLEYGLMNKIVKQNFSVAIVDKNSSGDEIANVNFFYNIAH